jgi:RNA polymerase sigma-70 factor (ECF subfamily)
VAWNPFVKNRITQQLGKLRPQLYRVAYAWTHAEHLADDLVQETCLKALQKCNSLRDEKVFRSWCFTILANCWKDHLRRQRPEDDIDEIVLTNDETLEDYQHRNNVTHLVNKAIESLPMAQREIVTLIDLEGFSYAEVAGILDIPIGTVMSRLCRARKYLTGQLLDLRETVEHAQPTAIRRVR